MGICQILLVCSQLSGRNVQSAILAPLSRKFAGRAEIIKTGLRGCAFPLLSHKLVKASVDTLKHIPVYRRARVRYECHLKHLRPVFSPSLHSKVVCKCCMATYFGDQPRHLTRYSTLPCYSGGKNGETRVKRQSFSPSAARFGRARSPRLLPCGCASFRCPQPQRRALRRRGAPFSAESDCRGGGGRGTGRGTRVNGRMLATRRRCVFPIGACCARLVVFQLYPNPSVFPLALRSPSLSLSLLPSAHSCDTH